ncbi:NAD(P)/FAD-dependent oxidoreductase [Streptomyces europaeiscabiei]|uniref:NAD(P)/FAD-dependent oxidoreductase n=1 Tax=Streptomyces europaeiscabiei TaxID=146819 RepID=UPI0007C72136|nr:tryptophan 7-halogenase [Streptomyces europaeiscabiei]MDX3666036.1 tryptophan 7-halogenase [Streptomyces europaeiscabiei]
MDSGGPSGCGKSRRFDVLVAGAGPAGCAASLPLVRAGASVVLVSPASWPDWQVGESLAPTARPLLERLGVLDGLAGAGHASCYGNQAAWGQDELTAVDHQLGPYGEGWHLDRTRFDAALLEATRAGGALWLAGHVRDARRHRSHWQITTGEGGVLEAGCLVDATGRAARLARRVGAARTRSDRLIAVAGLLGPPRKQVAHLDRTSLVQATRWGWWYTAPLPGGERILMAMTDADLLVSVRLLDPDVWWTQAQGAGHIRERIAGWERPQRRLHVLAAGSSCITPAAGPGWLAVGDAATATDPLAARGIVTALATGLVGARAILATWAGDTNAMAAYARRVTAVHAEYLETRAAQYRREQRWDTPFWNRRH